MNCSLCDKNLHLRTKLSSQIPPLTSHETSYLTHDEALNQIKDFKLNIVCMNVQSFQCHLDNITTVIDELKQPEILMFGELWSPYLPLLNLDNYQAPLVKIRQSKRGGGVGIWIKENIKIVFVSCIRRCMLKTMGKT